MSIKCDVLVIGGGPAGLAASITTSSKGLNTILMEKSSEIGYPIKTSAISWKEVIDSWKLPDKTMYQWYNSFYINSLHSKRDIEVNFKGKELGALNYHVFLQELAFKAAQSGTKIALSEKIMEPILDDDFVIGAKTRNKEIKSKIVIDCSGSNAILGKKMDLIPKRNEIGIGIENEMTNFRVRNPRSLDFFVGEEIVPIGYGWVFPVANDRARVGICTVYNAPEEIKEKNIRYWYDKFISEKSPIYNRIENAQPYEIHTGTYPLCGMLEKPYANGLIMAGDSAAQASMLIGEGIRYALEFGKRAAITASEAIKINDYSEDTLSNYVNKCHNYLGETFNVAADLLQVPTNEYWETLIDNIIRLKEKSKQDLVLTYLKTAMDYKTAKLIFPEFKGKYLK